MKTINLHHHLKIKIFTRGNFLVFEPQKSTKVAENKTKNKRQVRELIKSWNSQFFGVANFWNEYICNFLIKFYLDKKKYFTRLPEAIFKGMEPASYTPSSAIRSVAPFAVCPLISSACRISHALSLSLKSLTPRNRDMELHAWTVQEMSNKKKENPFLN